MRPALALCIALTGCYPDVRLEELGAFSVVFEGEQTARGVTGMVGFLNDLSSPSARGNFHCRGLGQLSATLASGQRLDRAQADCAPGEFEERFVGPEGVADDDLNVLLSDGERTIRVVIPETLRPLQLESADLMLTPEQDTPLRFASGDYVQEEFSVAFLDETGGARWEAPGTCCNKFRAGPGEPPLSGQLVLTGLLDRMAPVCRGFNRCRSRTRFSIAVPARY